MLIHKRCLILSLGLLAFGLSSITPVCLSQDAQYGLETADQPPVTAESYATEFFKNRKSLTRFGLAISEDNNECYFAVALNDNGYFREEIRVTKRENDGTWSTPQPLLPKEKKYKYVDPHFSPDNQRLYFIYTKPVDESKAPKRQMFDIWYVQKQESGWGDPVNLGAPISTNNANEYFVSLTSENKVFFGSNRANGNNFDLYSASLGKDDQYNEPKLLPGKVNTDKYEADVFVAPDESYAIFSSSGRKDGKGRGDLYVSFKDASGNWGEGKNLGERVNSKQQEFAPSISRDGKALFFSRGGAIHWVTTSVIEDLRPPKK